jgi:transposase
MSRRRFSNEFKENACQLVSEEKQTVKSVSESLGINQASLSRWLKDRELSKLNPTAKEESKKIKALESEIHRLKMEKTILKKAMAYFMEKPE